VTDSSGVPLHKLIAIIERLYPPGLAEGWDSVGLIAGDPHQRVRRVLLAVDPVATVVDEAIELGADLVITHHPLFLRPVHSMAANTFKGDVVHRLTRHGIALYNAHTNADSAPRGVADALAAAIGVQHRAPIIAADVSEDFLTMTKRSPGSVLTEPAGATGANAEPVAVGIGRVGMLPAPMSLIEFGQQVAAALPATAQGVRVAGDLTALVQRVAVVGGAGDSLFDAVRAHEVDVYVTADLRHHPASEAQERAIFEARTQTGMPQPGPPQSGAARQAKPFLIDVSHFASEWPWLNYAASDMAAAVRGEYAQNPATTPAPSQDAVTFIVSNRVTDPWATIIVNSPQPRQGDTNAQ